MLICFWVKNLPDLIYLYLWPYAMSSRLLSIHQSLDLLHPEQGKWELDLSKWEKTVNACSNTHSSPPYWDSALLHQAQACPGCALSHYLKTLNKFTSNCSLRGLSLSRIQKVCTLILPRGYNYFLPQDIQSILSNIFIFAVVPDFLWVNLENQVKMLKEQKQHTVCIYSYI